MVGPCAWRVHPPDSRAASRLAASLGVDPLTAQLLLNRGVTTHAQAQQFFHPSLEAFADSSTLPDVTRGVARLRRAIAKREPILIFGDSDVDGLTSSVILYEVLHELGAVVRAKASNRIADGYGLPLSIVQQLCRSATRVVILVDCGTNQSEAIHRLAAHHIDVIVIDHHLPLGAWAEPYALINPQRDPTGTCRELSSAGLAFLVARALLDGSDESLSGYLDLAALGLLADCAPLLRVARSIVSQGLARIIQSDRPGLQRLCESTQTTQPDPEQITRRLVPRLNASGRLGDPSAVWHLLRSDVDGSLEAWMTTAEAAHATTKHLHRRMIAEAEAQVSRLHFRDQFVMVVSREGWHQGLMGPLASQLTQRYGRPAIALALTDRQGTGSGRSIPLFNLLDALKSCQELLVQFGGHAQACGLTVDLKHLPSFRALVNQQAERSLGREGLVRTRTVDLELALEDVTARWVEEVARFAPFGHGNPRPAMIIRRVRIESQSPRMAVLSDGATRCPAKGRFSEIARGGSYDVVASPTLTTDGDVLLTVSDVKASTEPWEPVPISGTTYTHEPA